MRQAFKSLQHYQYKPMIINHQGTPTLTFSPNSSMSIPKCPLNVKSDPFLILRICELLLRIEIAAKLRHSRWQPHTSNAISYTFNLIPCQCSALCPNCGTVRGTAVTLTPARHPSLGKSHPPGVTQANASELQGPRASNGLGANRSSSLSKRQVCGRSRTERKATSSSRDILCTIIKQPLTVAIRWDSPQPGWVLDSVPSRKAENRGPTCLGHKLACG